MSHHPAYTKVLHWIVWNRGDDDATAVVPRTTDARTIERVSYHAQHNHPYMPLLPPACLRDGLPCPSMPMLHDLSHVQTCRVQLKRATPRMPHDGWPRSHHSSPPGRVRLGRLHGAAPRRPHPLHLRRGVGAVPQRAPHAAAAAARAVRRGAAQRAARPAASGHGGGAAALEHHGWVGSVWLSAASVLVVCCWRG